MSFVWGVKFYITFCSFSKTVDPASGVGEKRSPERGGLEKAQDVRLSPGPEHRSCSEDPRGGVAAKGAKPMTRPPMKGGREQ